MCYYIYIIKVLLGITLNLPDSSALFLDRIIKCGINEKLIRKPSEGLRHLDTIKY